MCLKPKFKKFNWLVKLITFSWPLAITLAPFGIYVNQKYRTLENVSSRTKNHECIHWQQQLETAALGLVLSLLSGVILFSGNFHWWILLILIAFPLLLFYIIYLLEWLIKIFIYGSRAYRNLSSEREAYAYDDDLNYLKTRKRYKWLKYIFTKP